jgi:quercetin dioxygenase-like cupin family protein
MKAAAIIAIATLFPFVLAKAQESPGKAIEIADEPHHSLLLQNDKVRVFHLKLQPGEATLRHRHSRYYVYLSLRPMTIANEVQGRQPVITRLEAGELHTSKGGFILAERNNSPEPADLFVIEATKASSEGFATPMGGFRFHDTAFGELFDAPVMRGYSMVVAVGGRTEQHTENYDRLLVAISDLNFRETVDGRAPAEFQLKAGDMRWVPRGMTHAITNIGASPAIFITLEFA